MINNFALVGRLVKDIEIEKIDDDKEMVILHLAVPRAFKNIDREYDTDFIQIIAFNGIATKMSEYCKKGDLVGVKGRIESYEDKSIRLVAEKVTFLSQTKKEEEN